MNLNGKSIAVVLSGGGAKGAYQIGMFRALEEAGLKKDRLTLAGTSIGALNSLMYAIKDTDSMRKMIHALGDGIKNDEAARTLMKEYYPDDLLLANQVPVGICAYCIEHERPEYFQLTGLPAQEQRDLCLASASLPDLLSPMPYKSFNYLDGGKIPPQCSKNAAPCDKIPVSLLEGGLFDIVVISYLKPQDQVDTSFLAKDTLVIESRPSIPLEDTPDTGTRDFSGERLKKNERMGYEETRQLLTSLNTGELH